MKPPFPSSVHQEMLLALLLTATQAFPTGKLFYSTWTGGRPAEVWVAQMEGGKVKKRSQIKGVSSDYEYRIGPFVSPNGRLLVFRKKSGYFLHNLATHRSKPLPGIADWVQIAWAPDNRRLLVAKSNATFYQYTLYDTATAQATRLPEEASRADWLPDGKTLLFTKVAKQKTRFWTYPAKNIDVEKLMGPCFVAALEVARVPHWEWQVDYPWADLYFSPSRRLAVYTLVDPRENSFHEDDGPPTMASFAHLPMYTILRDAKTQRSKTEIGPRTGFIPLAWSKDETAVLGRRIDYDGEVAVLRDGKLRSIDLGVPSAQAVAFVPAP